MNQGASRRVRLSADELARLTELLPSGAPVSVLDSLRGFVRSHAGRIAVTAVSVVAATLVGPAISKQWSDHKQAISTKNGLVAGVSGAVSNAIFDAQDVESSQSGAARHRVLAEWRRDQNRESAGLRIYFTDREEVSARWFGRHGTPGYRDVVDDYVELACCNKRTDRKTDWQAADVKQIFAYLAFYGPLPNGQKKIGPQIRHIMAVLADPRMRTAHADGFDAYYRNLGTLLVEARDLLLAKLMQEHARGFSVGWHDFIHDVVNPVD